MNPDLSSSSQPFRRARPLLGTLVEVTLFADSVSEDQIRLVSEAFALIEAIHHSMSAHSVDSDLAGIARHAHQRPVPVSPVTAEVLRLSLQYAAATGGGFDPVRAGGLLVLAGRRPALSSEAPDAAACWRDLHLDGCEATASRPLALDLGGIAKGYAVDLACDHLEAASLDGLVNAGGDLRFFGAAPRTVQLRRPDAPGEFYDLSNLPHRSLATTSAYGSLDETGESDLVNPLTGGAGDQQVSITVFADTCALADALTKAVLNLPAEAAAKVLRAHDAVSLVLRTDGSILELPGLPAAS